MPTTQPLVAAAPIMPDAAQAVIVRQGANRFPDLLARADLVGAVASGNAITLFVPSDAAFAAMPPGISRAVEEGDPRVIRRLLAGHMAWGRHEFTRIGPTSAVRTLAGDVQFMNKHGSEWSFAGAHVDVGDQPAGPEIVLHFIDAVLMPARWEFEDAREIVTDAAIAMSGPTGGLQHAPTCPLTASASARPEAPATTAVDPPPSTPKYEKPQRPTGPRGGPVESIASVDPTYDPNDVPPPPATAPTAARPAASNGSAIPGKPRAETVCTCGLLSSKP